MIIIPFDKKIERDNLPFITFLLIFINVLVYFSFQFNDDDKYGEAINYYYSSSLNKIELPRYKEYLITHGDSDFVHQWQDIINKQNSPWFFRMETDKNFMVALKNGQVIIPNDPLYARWQEKREALDLQLNQITTYTYSLKSGAPTTITLFSHMFLHGNVSHLVGNMLFLLALGFIVERSIKSRALYLASYLAGGLGSALFFLPFDTNSLMPSLGASGAIAGLMGMYTVLFHIRKIRFFYFIYVYFDYVKLPAITLLPLWLGFEIYQQISFSNVSNVNYLAHIGGLISGAAIAFVLSKFFPKTINHDYLNENDNKAEFEASLDKADAFIRELNHEKAVPILQTLYAESPDNREVLYQYYKASKMQPNSADYHQAALTILALPDNDAAANKLIKDVFNHYISIEKPRFTATLIGDLALRFAKQSEFTEAEKLIFLMKKQALSFQKQFPNCLLILIRNLLRDGQRSKAMQYNQYLAQNYPTAIQTQRAMDLLK